MAWMSPMLQEAVDLDTPTTPRVKPPLGAKLGSANVPWRVIVWSPIIMIRTPTSFLPLRKHNKKAQKWVYIMFIKTVLFISVTYKVLWRYEYKNIIHKFYDNYLHVTSVYNIVVNLANVGDSLGIPCTWSDDVITVGAAVVTWALRLTRHTPTKADFLSSTPEDNY